MGKTKKQLAAEFQAKVAAKANDYIITERKSRIAAKTPGQKPYIEGLNNGEDLIFGLGPAGTGKTFLAIAKATELLLSGKAEKIILTRPAVTAGEDLGYLPGDINAKLDPFMRPLHDALSQLLDTQRLSSLRKSETIEIIPISYMRGRTIRDSVIVLDEAQNCTYEQLKMATTRIGHGSKMFVAGDPEQSDLPKGESGLNEFVNAMKHDMRGIGIYTLTNKDVVRSPIVGRVLQNLEKHGREQPEPEQVPSLHAVGG